MMRERLVNLIADARNEYYDYSDELHEKGMSVPESSEEYIADYLIANGVVVMPCKVGNTIYVLSNGMVHQTKVIEIKYEAEAKNYGKFVRERIYAVMFNVLKEFNFSDVGKTVFLTREDAERALKGVTDKHVGGKMKGGVLDADQLMGKGQVKRTYPPSRDRCSR